LEKEKIMEFVSRFAPALGRLFLAVLFLASGANKLQDPAAAMAYIEQAGLPLPSFAYAAAALVEVLGGLLLLVGYQARIAAAALAGFSIVAAVFFHSNFADVNQAIHFMKNVAIAGGLLQVVAFGAGAFSLDHRNSTRAERLGLVRG
jgi:putative oxidoreductase